MSLQLLPSGYFEIHLKNDNVIRGQFSAKVFKMLSLKHGGLSFTETMNLLTTNASVESFLDIILFAIDEKYTHFDVLEWLEELGGFDSEDAQKLFAHSMDGFVSKKKAVVDGTLASQS